jgi:hypothetical protein
LQVSIVQALESDGQGVPTVTGVNVQRLTVRLHVSVVQELLSLQSASTVHAFVTTQSDGSELIDADG